MLPDWVVQQMRDEAIRVGWGDDFERYNDASKSAARGTATDIAVAVAGEFLRIIAERAGEGWDIRARLSPKHVRFVPLADLLESEDA